MSGERISGDEFNAASQLVRQALAVLADGGETVDEEQRQISLRFLADALDVIEHNRDATDARERSVEAERSRVYRDDEVRRDREDLKHG